MPIEDELLAQFEQESDQECAAISADSEGGEEYQAFNVTDRRQLSLYVRPVGEPYQWLSFRYLLHTVAAPDGSRLDLVFSFLILTVTGRNLLEVGAAISNERCGFLQQFDAKRWPTPKDTSAAFVESIKYLQAGPSDMTAKPKADAA